MLFATHRGKMSSCPELGDVWHKLGVEGTDGEFRPTLYFLADRGYIVLCESNEVYPDSLFNFQTRVGLKKKGSKNTAIEKANELLKSVASKLAATA